MVIITLIVIVSISRFTLSKIYALKFSTNMARLNSGSNAIK